MRVEMRYHFADRAHRCLIALECRSRRFALRRLPALRCLNKRRKNRARKSALRVGALRVPLHRYDKVVGRIEFHRLDHAVAGRDRS